MNATMPLTTRAIQSSTGGEAGWGLLLLGALLVILLCGLGAGWEYTGRDGRTRTIDWYDATARELWPDPKDSPQYQPRPRGRS